MDNTSGQGKGAGVPEEVRGISWGAFWWTFIWGIFNRVWFSFLVLVPVVGFFAWLILLFKGRQWAWENKRWDSVEHFNSVQRKWGLSGLILLAVIVALSVGAVFMGVLVGGSGEPVTASKAPPPSTVAKTPVQPVVTAVQPVVKPAAPPIQPVAVVPAAVKPAAVPETKPAPVVETKRVAVARTAVKTPATPPARPSVANAEPTAEQRAPRTVVMEAPPSLPAAPLANPSFNDLMTAVLYRNSAGVNELLALGKWPDKPDSNGTTPLMAAVMLGDAVNAETLLKAGADPNAGARNGSTAASLARERKDGAMTALLQRYGAR